MRWAAPLVLLASGALAHPQGFHKKVVLNVSLYRIDGLIAMDVDGGERCRLIRDGADSNRDGQLSGDEVKALEDKLVRMATRALKLSLSGFPIPFKVKETKIDLRKDHAVTETGVSVAVLLEDPHPAAVSVGTNLQIEDSAPDLSPVRFEVNQVPPADAGVEPPSTTDLESGVKWKVRLGPLAAQ
ncbi:MAG: hypothetical protein QM723_11195 [Myxococcaceae bacterium]